MPTGERLSLLYPQDSWDNPDTPTPAQEGAGNSDLLQPRGPRTGPGAGSPHDWQPQAFRPPPSHPCPLRTRPEADPRARGAERRARCAGSPAAAPALRTSPGPGSRGVTPAWRPRAALGTREDRALYGTRPEHSAGQPTGARARQPEAEPGACRGGAEPQAALARCL